MSEETTQPVVDAADTTAQPVVQANDARNDGDDLDTLLKQFDQGTKAEAVSPPATEQTQQTQTAPAVDPVRLQRIEERLFREDLDRTVVNIMGDVKVSKRMATGWVDQMARERPAVAQAFMNRHSNPEAWGRIERSLAKEFAKEMKQFTSIDPQVTEDREIVAAAVRGASTKAPESKPVKMDHLSNAEYRRTVMEQYGFDPGV